MSSFHQRGVTEKRVGVPTQVPAAFGPCTRSPDVEDQILEGNDFLQEMAVSSGLAPRQVLRLFDFKTASSSDGASPPPATLKRKNPEMPYESAIALGVWRARAASACAPSAEAPHIDVDGRYHPGNSNGKSRTRSASPRQRRDDVLSLMTLEQQESETVEERVMAALSIPCIQFALLAPNAVEGRVVEHGMRLIDSSSGFFKIGITENPAHRWTRIDGGYEHTAQSRSVMVKRMQIIYAADTTIAAGMLESALIMYGRLKWPTRCLNEKPGGEGKSTSGCLPHFTYIVFS
jgi:hypothetical protein